MPSDDDLRRLVEQAAKNAADKVSSELAAGKEPFSRDRMVEILNQVSEDPDLSDPALRQWERDYYALYELCRSMDDLAAHLEKTATLRDW